MQIPFIKMENKELYEIKWEWQVIKISIQNKKT